MNSTKFLSYKVSLDSVELHNSYIASYIQCTVSEVYISDTAHTIQLVS